MSIKKVGDWDKVRKIVKSLGKDMDQVSRKTLLQIGLKAERIAVKHIQAQDLPWTANIRYTRWKVKSGFSQKILVKTSTYMQSITSWPSSDGKTVYAGVKKQIMTKSESGESVLLADVALTLEYGTRDSRIPARPLWRPTYQETLKWIKDENVFAKEASKFYKNKYGE